MAQHELSSTGRSLLVKTARALSRSRTYGVMHETEQAAFELGRADALCEALAHLEGEDRGHWLREASHHARELAYA